MQSLQRRTALGGQAEQLLGPAVEGAVAVGGRVEVEEPLDAEVRRRRPGCARSCATGSRRSGRGESLRCPWSAQSNVTAEKAAWRASVPCGSARRRRPSARSRRAVRNRRPRPRPLPEVAGGCGRSTCSGRCPGEVDLRPLAGAPGRGVEVVALPVVVGPAGAWRTAGSRAPSRLVDGPWGLARAGPGRAAGRARPPRRGRGAGAGAGPRREPAGHRRRLLRRLPGRDAPPCASASYRRPRSPTPSRPSPTTPASTWS